MKISAEDANAKAEAEPKFIPFTGSSKRLDGKPIKQQEPTMSSHITDHRIEANKKIKLEDTASTLLQSSSSGQKLGKLVFGSSSSPHAPKEIPKVRLLAQYLCFFSLFPAFVVLE